MKNSKKKLAVVLSVILIAVFMFLAVGSSESSKVNHNMSKQAQYFECERRITVYNAVTDKIILEVEGYMNIENNSNGELVVTCKTGKDEYKMDYVYLNENFTMYTVEDISGTHTDPYHYKFYIHTENLPSVEVKP